MTNSTKINLNSLFLFYGSLSTVAILWIWIGNLPARLFGVKGVVLACLLGFFMVALSLISTDKSKWGKKLEEKFAKLLVPLPFTTIFLVALLSSIGEELFFRGAVQNQFGIVIASITFGLVHLPVTKDMIPWTIVAVIMGFMLG